MSGQHTPGPWHVVPYGDGDSLVICADDAGNYRISFMATPGCRDLAKRERDWKKIKANARLIAAAPELLAALEHSLVRLEWLLKDAIENGHPEFIADSEEAVAVARAAIAKAKGGAVTYGIRFHRTANSIFGTGSDLMRHMDGRPITFVTEDEALARAVSEALAAQDDDDFDPAAPSITYSVEEIEP